MNAIEATERLSELKIRLTALSNAVYRLLGDRDFRDDANVLNEIKNEVHAEITALEDKLRAVQL
jgi:hypothetical protein